MDPQLEQTAQRLKELGGTPLTIDGLIQIYSPCTDPRPLRTKELLERQRQEVLNRQPASTSKLYGQHFPKSPRPGHRNTQKTLVVPKQTFATSTEPRPLRTKELLESQRKEVLNRQLASTSKLQHFPKSTTSKHLDVPILVFSPCTEPRPLRTKELLERQRQMVLNRQPASTSKLHGQQFKSPKPGHSLRVPTPSTLIHKLPTSLANNFKTRRQLFFSADKEKDEVQQKIQNLVSYLRQVNQFQRITEAKLSQLSIQDFVSILNHLLPLSGVAQQTKLNKFNYVEQTIRALEILKYPHRVNRSLLLMPGTRQVLRSTINILEFLVDIASAGNMENVEDEKTFADLPKPSGNWVAEVKDYELLVEELTFLDTQLETECNPGQELEQLLEEKAQLEEELKVITDELKEFTIQDQKLAQLHIQYGSQYEVLNQLKVAVAMQTQTPQYYRALLNDQSRKYDALQFQRRCLQDLGERLRIVNLKRKRSRKELNEHIEAFNVQMRDIQYSTVINISCPKLELPLNTSLKEIMNRRLLLQQIRQYLESTVCKGIKKREPLKELEP